MLIRPDSSRTMARPTPAPLPVRRGRRRTWWLLLLVPVTAIVTVVGVLLTSPRTQTAPPDVVFDTYTGSSVAASSLYAVHCASGDPIQVKAGDSIASISKQLGVSLKALAGENGLNTTDTLVAGELLCPPSGFATQTVLSAIQGGEPCQSTNYWVANIGPWVVPPGCYANIYKPDPKNFPNRPSYGWCNWWPEVMHPELQGDAALHLPRHTTPIPGATVWFDPYEQGAGSAGHYALVIAVHPDGYWVLIAEMNNDWRGAGWSKVDYRYIHVSPHVFFLY